MPLLHSAYRPPFWLCNGHIQTLWPVLFRAMPALPCERRRIGTPDNDFLDIDIHRPPRSSGRRAVILSHGLEGNSRRKYILGMVRQCLALGCDALAWNMRSCSGEMNRTDRMYHMGETGDLSTVVRFALESGYESLALVGFSMGGNQILRWLGTGEIPAEVRAAAVVSVPCDLPGSTRALDRPINQPYMQYFLRPMRKKVREKAARFPEYPSLDGLDKMKLFSEFDGRFTAPLYGYASARDYWRKNSSLPVLDAIRLPTYLLMAQDDPFCSPSCFPCATAERSPNFWLETPRHGGHVGFVTPGSAYWSERQVLRFLREHF